MKCLVPEAQDLRGRYLLGRQWPAVVAMLRIAAPRLRQLPSALQRQLVERRSRVGHSRIEVGELAVELLRERKRLAHGLKIVIRQAEDEVADHKDARLLDLAHDLDDIRLVKRLLGAVAHVGAARLYAECEPADSRLAQQAQPVWSHRIDTRIGPNVQL